MKKILIFIPLLIFVYSCAATPEKFYVAKAKNIIEVENQEFHVWFDIMPNSKSNINLSGVVRFSENDKYDYKTISLFSIDIYQNMVKVYSVEPVVKENKYLNLEDEREIIVSLFTGLRKAESLSTDLPVDFVLNFKSGKNNFTTVLEDLQIERVN
ncbi:MAG: hypothetical protein K9J12_09525 [Melioribacteraceae bacterium]|nr:hypothetical protein [Melioribacteraceae bacterium]MCF8266248.1 hypothetical protein [Melioribacteraceae bacterium]MCF8412539.1 hypothetical protein [Melioribacteraceae bacterium]MCF8432013.1 hypothetical protein [Melioribacteraceae bacterium]